MVTQQRKAEQKNKIIGWLKKRLNAGLLEKTEYDAKAKLVEQSTDKLVSDEEAKAFFKTLGVIDEEDLGYGSPEKKASKKLDAQEEEAAKAAKELAKRMKAKKKQIEALKAEREKKIQEAALKLEEERK